MKLRLLSLGLFLQTLALVANANAGVCDRTEQIRDYLVQDRQKACDDITAEDLLLVTAIRVPNTGITALKPGDLDGLKHVQTLNLKRNKLTELPVGILSDLTDLRVVVLLGNQLTSLPDDFLVNNLKVEKIHMFQNSFTTISDQVIANLVRLPKLNVLEVGKEVTPSTRQRLNNAFPREDEVVTLIFT